MKGKLKDISTGLIIYTLLGVMGVFLLPYASTSKENTFKVIKLYCRVVFWILKKVYNIEILVKGVVPDHLHVVPIRDDATLDGARPAGLASRLITHIDLLVVSDDHNAWHLGAIHD